VFIEKTYSPFLSTYIVFNYLFFLAAPMSQVNTMLAMESPEFTNRFPFDSQMFIVINLMISLFHIIFFVIYVGGKSLIRRKKKQSQSHQSSSFYALCIGVFLILTGIIFIGNLSFLMDEFTRPNWLLSEYSIPDLLIRKKVLFLVPLVGIVLCFQYLEDFKINTQQWFLIATAIAIFLLFLIIFKNPLTEKRNALGPIYLLLIFLMVPRLLNSNVKTSFLLFFSMIVLFPALQFITHVDYGFEELVSNPSLIFRKNNLNEGYMSLNYDAFINIGVVMEYVQQHGFSYGYQLLSGLLFFVPRSIWPDKPMSSGLVVGNQLIEEHGFWFNNVSNPYLAEGYLNFGWIGIILLAFVLGITVVYFITWLYSNDFLKKAVGFYFAMHLIFLLRGDFTNGYSYFIGTLIGIYILPKIIIGTLRVVLLGRARIWSTS
jgi:hypothetical protein